MELKPHCEQPDARTVPEGWVSRRLGEFGEFLKGRGVKRDQAQTGVLPCVRYGELYTTHHEIIRSFTSWIAPNIAATAARLRCGDILFAGSGETKEEIGKCAAFVEDVEAYAGGDIVIFRQQKVDPTFLGYVLNTSCVIRQKAGHAQGDAVVHISSGALSKLQVLLPSISEQRAIATALSDVDVLITKLDQLIAKKRDIKQASMQQLLTGKTRLPGFSEEWAVKRLDTLATIDPESLSSSTDPAYGFKYISLEDVDKGTLRGYSEQAFDTAPSRARRVLRHSDILISTVRPNLQSHLLFGSGEADWVCSTGFSVVRCLPNVAHPGFVYQQLFAYGISKQIDAILTGSNYPAINSGDVRRLSFPAPGYEEQAAIASVLSDVDAELATLEARRDKTKALKQGMMQVLLTGQVRLPVNKEPMEALA